MSTVFIDDEWSACAGCIERAIMKKILKGILVGLMILPSLSVFADQNPAAQKSWFQRHFVRPTIQEATSQCAAPQDVCKIVNKYVASYPESVNRWAGAEETWKRGWGDCEDFSVCVEQLCHELGYDAQVYLFYPINAGDEGHAVVVGKWNDQLWMSSLGSYKQVASMDDVRKEVARIIGCKPDRMWNVTLAHEDVQRFLTHKPALSTAVTGK
jgi:hypothetical protein